MAGIPKAFIVGHPIKHSRSPLIHRHWLERYGLAGSYETVDVAPETFAAFLESFGRRGFRGGNVTIPHKEAAFRLCHDVSDRARRLEAVNTLWIENGRIQGDNTDVTGFVASLDEALGSGWDKETGSAVVVGAGGAARAVVAGLLDRGVETVFVANRTLERAQDLQRLDRDRVRPLPWAEMGSRLGNARLLVNTTSLGMTGQPALTLDLSPLPDRAVVADIVYVPLETPLLAAARARGLRTVNGLGMLLHQASPGFMRWFGVEPDVTPELRALVSADVGKQP